MNNWTPLSILSLNICQRVSEFALQLAARVISSPRFETNFLKLDQSALLKRAIWRGACFLRLGLTSKSQNTALWWHARKYDRGEKRCVIKTAVNTDHSVNKIRRIKSNRWERIQSLLVAEKIWVIMRRSRMLRTNVDKWAALSDDVMTQMMEEWRNVLFIVNLSVV